MNDCFELHNAAQATTLIPLDANLFDAWLERQPERMRNWVKASRFQARAGHHLALPETDGCVRRILVGIDLEATTWAVADLPGKLREGVYTLDCDWTPERRVQAAIGWGLGSYRFERYRRSDAPRARLSLAGLDNDQVKRVEHTVAAIGLVRDLINTPAEDMMPEHLAESAEQLGKTFGATVRQVVGDDLLEAHYPSIHRVGRASHHAPRVIDLQWGDDAHPQVTLVGKGVCFDTGGLDIKPSNGMRLMKKDMGGAAHVLGLAHLIMAAGLPVRLRVLIGAVDNAIDGNAFRPGDVITTRKGLTVEVDNTDAEGRLVLCDLLTQACEETPALIIDFATLTGAARVAVGTEIAAFLTDASELVHGLYRHAEKQEDPCWRLPLHEPYQELLESSVADLANSGSTPYAGAITAGLFLKAFVPQTQPWIHFDVMAWNTRARPGRPKGGEALGVRAVFAWLEERFSTPQDPDYRD
ncbi:MULTISPECIES: M17 family metallopeptidase [unclassified Ectothiorhodospira]|uniref:leucyl aminopeptidase family protein n=1 Tax=unclassified Ectothiorhodospira TaxID=2684909 RepID=UPI001EE89F17|nr:MULTISPECIES: leucyl aminopeptidase family protein [unclassified Ectothiorhodospira]MCG5516160.1 leucyl aminopeptidase family protein [Ectothiorhodospira sp. 9100]MCG5520155.1 leucyl aminopeptidase family protein [Ectothiorhodospira sp. 9905]